MAKSFTLYKLIILYMLNEVDFPLTNSQISEFILDEGYTTYFKLQQALSELLESGFIREESTHHRTFYHLTEDGAETIHYFTNDISPAIQHDEMSVKADYFENSNMEYSVRCQVIEQGLPLIDLTVTAPTESEAATIANNWQKRNQEIYALVMAKLL